MKQPKRLTREFKEIVSSQGYDADEWMIYKESEFYLFLIHKTNGKRITVDKFKRFKRR